MKHKQRENNNSLVLWPDPFDGIDKNETSRGFFIAAGVVIFFAVLAWGLTPIYVSCVLVVIGVFLLILGIRSLNSDFKKVIKSDTWWEAMEQFYQSLREKQTFGEDTENVITQCRDYYSLIYEKLSSLPDTQPGDTAYSSYVSRKTLPSDPVIESEIYDIKHAVILARARRDMFPHLDKATSDDIRFFGRNTSRYGSESHSDRIYIAHEDFTLVPLTGASAITILIPHGITVRGTDNGHITLIYEDGEIPL